MFHVKHLKEKGSIMNEFERDIVNDSARLVKALYAVLDENNDPTLKVTTKEERDENTSELTAMFVTVESVAQSQGVIWSAEISWFCTNEHLDWFVKSFKQAYRAYSKWLDFLPDGDYSRCIVFYLPDTLHERISKTLQAIGTYSIASVEVLHDVLKYATEEASTRYLRKYASTHRVLVIDECDE